MTEGGDSLLIIVALLAGLALLSFALLRGWEGWLRLRRLELGQSGPRPLPSAGPAAAGADRPQGPGEAPRGDRRRGGGLRPRRATVKAAICPSLPSTMPMPISNCSRRTTATGC